MSLETDSRYTQIQQQTLSETQAQQSYRAFTGFGRTTQLVSEVDTIQKANQARINYLQNVITIEEQIKNGNSDEGTYKSLAQAQNTLSEANQAAADRRSQIAQSLMGVGTKEETKHQVDMKYRKTFKQKTLKLNQPQTQFNTKIQKLETVKSFERIKPLSSLQSIGSSRTYSTLKTLANL